MGNLNKPGFFRSMVSEEDGSVSASRLVMFVNSIALILVFLFSTVYILITTKQMPQVGDWAQVLGFGAAGSSVGYLFNKIAGAIKKNE